MIIANRTLNVIDTAFSIIDRIERTDYIALGNTVINIAATTAAIIMAVTTYIITAVQLWWEDYGTTITTNGFRFIINLIDYSHELFVMGREFRKFTSKIANRAADNCFYAIAGLI